MSDPTPTTVMADPTDPQRGPAATDPATTAPATTDPAATRAPSRWRPTRRGFLIGAGVAGGGLAFGWVVGRPWLRLQIADMFENGSQPSSASKEPSAWFEIASSGMVTLFMTKVEMGQGIHTALAQVAAEELALPWSSLTVVQASTRRRPDDRSGTSGSSSMSSQYPIIRQAAATLREMLRQQAAVRLGLPLAQLVARDGAVVKDDDAAVRISYGDLVAGADLASWEAPAEVPLTDPAQFKVIGQSLPRVDLPAKLRGEAVFGYDARVPNLHYGAVARPPRLGARLVAAEAGPAAGMPGVVKVVIQDGFAGVVALSRAEAAAARNALLLSWEDGSTWQQADIDAAMSLGGAGGVTFQDEGDAGLVLDDAAAAVPDASGASRSVLIAEYASPLAAHVTMEPQAALADVHDGGAREGAATEPSATVQTATQMASLVQSKVAEAIGLQNEQVVVEPTYLGGGFGRKAGYEPAVEAAILSKAAGLPVHVGWTREEDTRHGYFRPPTHHRLRARLGADGKLLALEHQLASGDVARTFLPAWMSAVVGADFGATRGGRTFYDIPNRRAIIWRRELPVPTSWWRGLGLLANVFAIESFMDEAALAAGADPLAFRLRHLPPNDFGRRMRAVLEAAAERAGWGRPPAPGRALGIACCSDVDTVVAQVAEVSVDDQGQVRVHRITCALDCGLAVNPDGVIAQAEGAIVMGLSSALLEEITIADGQVAQTNFGDYPILTLRQTPTIDVLLLDAGDGKPRGAGEPPIGPVAAAVANALAALGIPRLRSLPLTAARVRAARDGSG
ncbi:MAG TPA: molybdopterin-dependent oxidoreductase [Anaerolineae bacterium]|nr:molybdopterin-dependent oxidoreductase [Anaerolineae bacterium]